MTHVLAALEADLHEGELAVFVVDREGNARRIDASAELWNLQGVYVELPKSMLDDKGGSVRFRWVENLPSGTRGEGG